MKRKIIKGIILLVSATMMFSVPVFAWGAQFLFRLNSTSSVESETGQRAKPNDGDMYAYVTYDGTENVNGVINNMYTTHALINFRVRDANRQYATEYCTVDHTYNGQTQKLRYLSTDPNAIGWGKLHFLYANVERTDSWPVHATGRWVP